MSGHSRNEEGVSSGRERETPEVYFRDLLDDTMSDNQIADALADVSQDELRHVERDRRPNFIFNDVLLRLDMMPELNSIFRPDGSVNPRQRWDAVYASEKENLFSKVRKDLEKMEQSKDGGKIRDFRDAIYDHAHERCEQTDLFRAFNQLRHQITNHELSMHGLVQAHRFAFAVMLYETNNREKE